jgi:hypothetical protein
LNAVHAVDVVVTVVLVEEVVVDEAYAAAGRLTPKPATRANAVTDLVKLCFICSPFKGTPPRLRRRFVKRM